MLRSLQNLFKVIALLTWTALWISAALLVALVTFNRLAPLRMARTRWAPGALRIAGATLDVEPLPDIDWSKPYVFAMNHQSQMDIPAAFLAIPTPLRFLAKQSLAWVPFLGWYMWFTGMVFIDRKNRARAMGSLRRAGEKVRAGASLLTYPEGTRSKDGSLQLFKRGSFSVAIEAQVPVVPVAVRGTKDVLVPGTLQLRPGHIVVKVGTPIPTVGLGPDDRDRLADQVRTAVARLLESLPPESKVPAQAA